MPVRHRAKAAPGVPVRHTGDLHLDSPFVGLTNDAPPSVAQTLREATIRAWDNVVELAIAEQVDFFLVAGDAFEHANRTLRGQLAFRLTPSAEPTPR